MQNIGLAGRAGSGKSTLAAELVKQGYEAVSFATPLKIDVGRLMLARAGGDGAAWNDEALAYVATHKQELRILLQTYGETARNVIKLDVWVEIAMHVVKHHNDRGVPVVIDDVRFQNEVAALKEAGFTVFRIERPWYNGGIRPHAEMAQHISERAEALDVHDTLVNDTTPEALYSRLRVALGWPHRRAGNLAAFEVLRGKQQSRAGIVSKDLRNG